MIPASVRAEILRRIRDAEVEHRVQVLLAIESGSWAWGFEWPDCDFDARFIYVHERDDDMTVATCRRSEHVARIVSTKLTNIDMSG